ncbi:hypothetical protein E1265_25125 [Streptomyces sp. 8K308]|uniref:hypothetical protein n=1 Tax=Streptomyces sp. 8K308 TaxID=2530388 RepID=UPI001044C347|nr:hypothetical protein [Streptomyces sp. 8K308]TDC18519.1 hypothetical protein E1265_25125 [Streptomyces sp. 8K308]
MTEANKLAALRRSAGHTQQSCVAEFALEAARLGIDATLTVRQLRMWERELPPPLPHPAQQVVLEANFGVPLTELGFVGSRTSAAPRALHRP